MGKENKEENELDRGEPEPPKSVSSSEVKKALEIVLNYVEQNESFNETDFFFINGLKSRIEEITQNNKQQAELYNCDENVRNYNSNTITLIKKSNYN